MTTGPYSFSIKVNMPTSYTSEELDAITEDKLFLYTGTEESSIVFAQSIGLLPKSRVCECGLDTSLRHRAGRCENYFSFRCVDRSCRKEVSIRKNTVFEKTHLKISVVLPMMYKF
ncbi:hypothetical protein H311_05005, partial [Anncaliia algerae PRA109]